MNKDDWIDILLFTIILILAALVLSSCTIKVCECNSPKNKSVDDNGTNTEILIPL